MNKLYFFIVGILVSYNLKAQWQATNGPFQEGSTYYSNINCLSYDGVSILAGSDRDGVFKSYIGFNEWTVSNTGLPYPTQQVDVKAILKNGSSTFIGTLGHGAYLSLNSGETWSSINSGLSNPYVTSFAVYGSSIFAGTSPFSSVNGVFKTLNNGDDWSSSNNGLSNNYLITSFTIKGSDIYVGTNAGVFVSSNNGSTWITASFGITDAYIRALTVCGDNLYAGTASGVFLSENNGGNWTLVNNGLTNTNISSFAVYGNNVFASTGYIYSAGDGVFLTSNNGNNWTPVNTGFQTNTTVTALVIAGTDIYAATDTMGVCRRPLTDFGITNIEKRFTANRITVFSNPVTHRINVRGIYNKETFKLFDSQGRILIKMEISDDIELEANGLTAGVYFVSIESAKESIFKRIILNI